MYLQVVVNYPRMQLSRVWKTQSADQIWDTELELAGQTKQADHALHKEGQLEQSS